MKVHVAAQGWDGDREPVLILLVHHGWAQPHTEDGSLSVFQAVWWRQGWRKEDKGHMYYLWGMRPISWQVTLLFRSHWTELSQVATLSCKESWKRSPPSTWPLCWQKAGTLLPEVLQKRLEGTAQSLCCNIVLQLCKKAKKKDRKEIN